MFDLDAENQPPYIGCRSPGVSMTDDIGTTPLHGLTIVDLTSIVFGPYCTQTLADMGAEVIKVEPPEGDAMRGSGAFARTRGMGAPHMTLNRGKRSLVLNLKSERDLEAMRRLLQTADVFIHNVRGAAIDRLGLDYDTVHALNPRLIYVHCVGYGSDGPYGDLPAYDDVIQAASGLTSLLPRVDGDPRPRYLPSTLVDKVAGLHAAYAILAAYIQRGRTRVGQKVEVPMFETFTHFLLEEHLAGATFDPPHGTAGYRRQIEPLRQPFQTADGYISIVPYGDHNWIKLFEAAEDTAILNDPRVATPALRAANPDVLYGRLAELTPNRTTQAWIDLLGKHSIPAVAVRDIADILDDPHLRETAFFRRREHPSEGGYYEMRPPVRFFGAQSVDIRFPPRLGEHNAEILESLGLGPDPVG